MPQLPRPIIKDRAARLRAKGVDMLAQRLCGLVGREENVLVEKPGFGRTPCFAPVAFEGDLASGTIARMRIGAAAPDRLIAERAA